MQADATSIPALFRQQVARYGDRAALLEKRQGTYTPISWAEYGRQVCDLAMGLVALGLEPGQHAALLCENRPEWLVADVAILSVGAVNVPLHVPLTAKQVEYILADSGCRLVIVSHPGQLEKVLKARERLPALEHVICIACPEASGEGLLSLQEVMARGAKLAAETGTGVLDERIGALEPGTLASIIYTSGTTGDPKGVMLTHYNFLSNVEACLARLPISDQDLSLNFLPLSHVFARTCEHYAMMGAGGTIAFSESAEAVANNMAEVHPTIMMAVPRFYEKLHAQVMDTAGKSTGVKRALFNWGMRLGTARTELHKARRAPSAFFRLKYGLADRLIYRKLKERLGGRLHFFVSGGAPLSRKIAEFFGGVGVTICEGYGLTESSPIICVNPVEAVRYGTVGPPVAQVEVQIAEDGEILTRGPHVMQGYFGREQETAETIVDGWLRTGDIGVLDEDGYLAITDRKKDLIVTAGGKNVAPQLIENALVGPYISQIVVIGDKRKFLSALVVPNFGPLEGWAREQGLKFASRAELVALPQVKALVSNYMKERLHDFAHYEHIGRFVMLDREFTVQDGAVTPTLKLKRKVIEQRHQELIDGMYEEELPG